MDVQRIIGRFGRRLLWCTLGAALALGPGLASAQDACANSSIQYPTCQNQVQAGVTYKPLQSQNWAYYCGGDHPNFYKNNLAYAFGNTCFTAVEHGSAENDNFDGGFTNWCLSSQLLVVVLACLPFNPN